SGESWGSGTRRRMHPPHLMLRGNAPTPAGAPGRRSGSAGCPRPPSPPAAGIATARGSGTSRRREGGPRRRLEQLMEKLVLILQVLHRAGEVIDLCFE